MHCRRRGVLSLPSKAVGAVAIEHDITTAELARNLRDYRNDTSKALHDVRNEMTGALGRFGLELDDLASTMSKGYVSVQLWEEVRRNQGERIGALEQRMAKLEEQSQARADAGLARLSALEKDVQRRFDERDKEAKADRRLVITALVAPFIMLVIGMVLTAVFAQ